MTLVTGCLIYIFPEPITATHEKLIILVMVNATFSYTTVYSTALFPWWSFRKITKSEERNDKEENTGDYRRVTGTSIPI